MGILQEIRFLVAWYNSSYKLSNMAPLFIAPSIFGGIKTNDYLTIIINGHFERLLVNEMMKEDQLL